MSEPDVRPADRAAAADALSAAYARGRLSTRTYLERTARVWTATTAVELRLLAPETGPEPDRAR